jgi:alpha-L-fucosidase
MHTTLSRRDLIAAAGAAALLPVCRLHAQTELKPRGPAPEPLPRVARFESLALGLFMHFGLYSLWERGEWIMHHGKIPHDDYFARLTEFHAKDLDARAVARLAKDAGMRYACLTARHHDGFSLYDTHSLSDHDITKTSAKRDIVEAFVEGCRAESIAPFLYHTTLDWSHPDFKDNFNAYLDYLHQSVELLCTNYGPLGGLWFDGNWSKPDADWKEDRLYSLIRKHQPEAVIINNTGIEARGKAGNSEIDALTFEVGRPTALDQRGRDKHLAAEMCQTTSQSAWGYAPLDFNHRSLPQIIEDVCVCRAARANYLLNVGPTPAGAIRDFDAAMLRRLGDWVRHCGDAVYEGRPGTITPKDPRDAALLGNKRAWFFIREPGRSATFSNLPAPVTSARWCDTKGDVPFSQNAGTLDLKTTGSPYGVNTIVRVIEATL